MKQSIDVENMIVLMDDFNMWYNSDDYNVSKFKAMQELKLMLIENIVNAEILNKEG